MYIEYVFLENFIIDYFILLVSTKMLKRKSKLIWLGSLLGSIVAVLYPLFNIGLVESFLIRIITALMLTSLCLYEKQIKRFILNYFVLLLITFVFGGAVEAVKEFTGNITLEISLLTTFIIFVIMKIVIKVLNRKKIVDNFSTKVRIIDNGKMIEEQGYYDSGNLLYDPITSQPICLITHEVFTKLYGGDMVNIFLNKIDVHKLKNGHYIDINSAVKKGRMLVFSVDELIVKDSDNERRFENVCLGLSFSSFEKAMHSEVLLHSSQLCC